MNTNSQRLFYNFTANRASLRCSPGVDFFVHSPGTFSLGFEYRQKDSPRHISDAFGKVSIFEHVLNIQVFNYDMIVCLNKRMRGFVAEIKTLICNFFVTLGNKTTGLMSSIAALLSAGKPLLSGLELLFRHTKKLRRDDLLAITRCDERIESDINADSVAGGRKGNSITLNSEGSIPIFVSAADAYGLNLTVNLPMPLYLNVPDILQVQASSLDLTTVPERSIVDRAESVKRLEPRIAGLISSLHSAKERLKRLIKPAKRLLQRTVVTICDLFADLSEFRQKRSSLSGISDALSSFLICVFSLSKCLVIEKAMPIKLRGESRDLLSGRIQAVFISLEHLFAFLLVDIFTDCCLADGADTAGKITSTPKRGETATKRCKFLTQNTTGISFQSVNNFSNASRRIMLNKQVNVIRHYFERMNCEAKFCRLFVEKFLEPFLNSIDKYLAPIFRAPYYMQFQVENSPGIFCISLIHDVYYTSGRYIMLLNFFKRRGELSAVA